MVRNYFVNSIDFVSLNIFKKFLDFLDFFILLNKNKLDRLIKLYKPDVVSFL